MGQIYDDGKQIGVPEGLGLGINFQGALEITLEPWQRALCSLEEATPVRVVLQSRTRTLEMEPFGDTLQPSRPPMGWIAVTHGSSGMHWEPPNSKWAFGARQVLDILMKSARFALPPPRKQIDPIVRALRQARLLPPSHKMPSGLLFRGTGTLL